LPEAGAVAVGARTNESGITVTVAVKYADLAGL
jgi:hypothetical protein